MGFIVSGGSIFIGGMIGGMLGRRIKAGNQTVLSIGIMLISVVGLVENILSISGGKIVGEHTVIVALALIVGGTAGDALKIEERIASLSGEHGMERNGFVDAVLFFGIGGLQISGPILYALEGDSFQLMLKGVIDFPFALMLGAAFGKKVSLSAPVIVSMQILTALLVRIMGSILGDGLVPQICSLGYLILFFSGYNLICSPKHRIKNINMIPGLFLIIFYNLLTEVF